ncbi:MAG TPA: DUF5947 family protein [Solirubrobacteraceae bacterium]|jgi:hypothetical protein|nr:DUF5947 family protein [Solirubrobacteraceae bacterium]
MAAPSGTLARSRLQKLAQRPVTVAPPAAGAAADVEEQCELCSAPIGPEHRHMLELSSRELLCACRPCSVLFDRKGAGSGRYKLVPERRLRLDDFRLGDPAWDELRVPVEMAFFFFSSVAERVLAYYPGPMGPTESQLQLSSWQQLERENPILAELEPDVEALLANRVGDERRYWLVPLDECYSLVGLIRTHWKGLSGGQQVWQEIDSFFADLDRRARSSTRTPRNAWQKGA